MVSFKRGTHLSKKCGFVQEGHTFIEKTPKAHAVNRRHLQFVMLGPAGARQATPPVKAKIQVAGIAVGTHGVDVGNSNAH